MKISVIYEKYQIMPQLQTHMIRVSAVASIIADNFQIKVDKTKLITATLLHDMGNIIKFDLKLFPENLEPKGLDYWTKVKAEYIEKYGSDEHLATLKICESIGADPEILAIVNAIGFNKIIDNYSNNNLEIKICAYSDMRVMPQKIDTLQNRLGDLKNRYQKRMGPERYKTFDETAEYFYKLEKQIFENCKIKPEDLTDEKAKLVIEKLKDYEISVNVK